MLRHMSKYVLFLIYDVFIFYHISIYIFIYLYIHEVSEGTKDGQLLDDMIIGRKTFLCPERDLNPGLGGGGGGGTSL